MQDREDKEQTFTGMFLLGSKLTVDVHQVESHTSLGAHTRNEVSKFLVICQCAPNNLNRSCNLHCCIQTSAVACTPLHCHLHRLCCPRAI